MRRRSIIGALAACVVAPALAGFVAASTRPGSLDSSFGTGGKATLALPGSDETAYRMALRPNGKIVVSGFTSNGSSKNYDFFVAQFNSTGAPDSSFGVNGHTAADFGGTEIGYAMALQPDGKIIVAGYASKTPSNVAVARINPNGLYDTSFGERGRATVDFGAPKVVFAAALRPDGRIVLAGGAANGSSTDLGIEQLTANGTVDGSFGVSGHTAADFGGDDTATAVAVQPDGKIVVAGYTTNGANGHDFAVTRINPNGLYDSSFGTGGKETIDFGGDDMAYSMALRPDGRIVVAGSTGKASAPGDFAVAQLKPNGTLDSSFGVGGRTAADFGGDEYGGALALRPDGKIVVSGTTSTGTNPSNFAVALIDSKGLFDRSFGAGGRATVDFGSDDQATRVAVQPNGKIVISGLTSTGTNEHDFAVARLLGAPTGKTLTAKIVSATVLGHGRGRTLDVKINVSEAAKAQVRLLKQGVERFQKLFNVKSGVNELKAPIPSTLQKGVYRLELAFRDAKGQHKTYRTDVTVPV